jgi:hypothetical protein
MAVAQKPYVERYNNPLKTEEHLDSLGDLLVHAEESDSFVWDPINLIWVRMTQPGGGGGGGAVTIADGADVAEGATTDAESAAGNGSVIALLKRLRTLIAGGLPAALVGGRLDVNIGAPLGQQLAAASVPVILPAATITTLTPPAAIVGFALEAGHLATIDGHLDVNLSTRLKPADTLAGVTTVTTVSTITNVVHIDDNAGSLTVDAPVATPLFARLSDGAAALIGQKTMAASLPVAIASDQSGIPVTNANLDATISSRLKPADTLTGVTTVATVTTVTTVTSVTTLGTITNPLPVGTNRLGSIRLVDSADADLTSAKGTQTARAVGVQELKDAGRNVTNYFMALPILTTAADVLMSLTGYKSGAAVGATTTPAVVTAGKTYRITSITIIYIATATAGEVRVSLRANTGGVVAVGSPVVCSWVIGAGTPATAGSSQTVSLAVPEGVEFAAGTGVGITIAGVSVVGVLAVAGYGQVALAGYEY